MKKGKLGFTLIEVSLFLAISGLLFVGITIGVQNSIYQQRKNDSVQSFVEFLRGVYDEVANVQNDGGGHSEEAIYGRLVTFGEKDDNKNEIFIYTVTGDVDGGGTGSGGALGLLKGRNAGVDRNKGYTESYIPKWSAQIEPPCVGDDRCYESLRGMLLVVRHPNSGAIVTYYSDKTGSIGEERKALKDLENFGKAGNQIDFCVNSDPGDANAKRIDVRILEGANNGSNIETIGDGEDDNKCENNQ